MELLAGFFLPCVSWSPTGTAGGDLVELSALRDVLFSSDDDAGVSEGVKVKIPIGSVKSNVGHCEAASGLVGLIKVCLAYRHQCLPGNLHFETPRHSIRDMLQRNFSVVSKNTPWAGGVAGVSSYGFGGVCCHLVLSDEVEELLPPGAECDVLPKCTTLSSRTQESLEELTDFLCSKYRQSPLPLSVSATASLTSREHPFRGFVMQQRESSEFDVWNNSDNTDTTPPKYVL